MHFTAINFWHSWFFWWFVLGCAGLCCVCVWEASLVFYSISFLWMFSLWIRAKYTAKCDDVLLTEKKEFINKATRSGMFCIHSHCHSSPHWRKLLPYPIAYTRATWCVHNNVCTRKPNSTFSSRKYFPMFFFSSPFENLFSWVWKVGNFFSSLSLCWLAHPRKW